MLEKEPFFQTFVHAWHHLLSFFDLHEVAFKGKTNIKNRCLG